MASRTVELRTGGCMCAFATLDLRGAADGGVSWIMSKEATFAVPFRPGLSFRASILSTQLSS